MGEDGRGGEGRRGESRGSDTFSRMFLFQLWHVCRRINECRNSNTEPMSASLKSPMLTDVIREKNRRESFSITSLDYTPEQRLAVCYDCSCNTGTQPSSIGTLLTRWLSVFNRPITIIRWWKTGDLDGIPTIPDGVRAVRGGVWRFLIIL